MQLSNAELLSMQNSTCSQCIVCSLSLTNALDIDCGCGVTVESLCQDVSSHFRSCSRRDQAAGGGGAPGGAIGGGGGGTPCM